MTKTNLIRLTTLGVIFTVVVPAMLAAGGRQEEAENSRETEDRSGSTRIELGESVNQPSDPPDTTDAETDKDALDGSENGQYGLSSTIRWTIRWYKISRG